VTGIIDLVGNDFKRINNERHKEILAMENAITYRLIKEMSVEQFE